MLDWLKEDFEGVDLTESLEMYWLIIYDISFNIFLCVFYQLANPKQSIKFDLFHDFVFFLNHSLKHSGLLSKSTSWVLQKIRSWDRQWRFMLWFRLTICELSFFTLLFWSVPSFQLEWFLKNGLFGFFLEACLQLTCCSRMSALLVLSSLLLQVWSLARFQDFDSVQFNWLNWHQLQVFQGFIDCIIRFLMLFLELKGSKQ